MKKIILFAFILFVENLVGQKITTKMIDQTVLTIEADPTLVRKEIDSAEDNKKLEIWYKGNEIFKIKSEKELLSGKHSVTIYLKGKNPINPKSK